MLPASGGHSIPRVRRIGQPVQSSRRREVRRLKKRNVLVPLLTMGDVVHEVWSERIGREKVPRSGDHHARKSGADVTSGKSTAWPAT